MLVDEPSIVNDDPLGDAWFFKMKPSDRARWTTIWTKPRIRNSSAKPVAPWGACGADIFRKKKQGFAPWRMLCLHPDRVSCRMILPTVAISGRRPAEMHEMFKVLSVTSLEALIDRDCCRKRSAKQSRSILASHVRARNVAPHADYAGQEQGAAFSHRAGLSRHGDATRDPAQYS